jgi:hypothetical protein
MNKVWTYEWIGSPSAYEGMLLLKPIDYSKHETLDEVYISMECFRDAMALVAFIEEASAIEKKELAEAVLNTAYNAGASYLRGA